MKLYDGTGNILSLNGTELGAEKANALDNMFRECAYKRYDYIPEKYNEFKKVFNIADTFYITNDLQNINTSNNSESVRYGESYHAVLTPYLDFVVEDAVATMNGEEITITTNADGTLSIDVPLVIGNIVITAMALESDSTIRLYQLTNQECNADFLEETNLSFGSAEANGIANDWTITTTFIIGSMSGDGTTPGYLCSLGASTPKGLGIAKVNSKMWGFSNVGSVELGAYASGTEYKVIATHKAGATDVTYHYVSDGTVVTNTPNGLYNNLGNSVYEGSLLVGGTLNEPLFIGTIKDFTIYFNKVYNETELAEYLGV